MGGVKFVRNTIREMHIFIQSATRLLYILTVVY